MPMTRTIGRSAWILAAWIFATCILLRAQDTNAPDTRTITVQLRDGRTGMPITPSNLLLRTDHHDTLHNEWVKINDDGTMTVTVPADAKDLSIQATYAEGMDTYINCDVAKQSDKERQVWYPIDLIVKSGAVAPNECSKTEYKAKPGEFVLFVRKRGALDRLHNMDAQ